MNLDDGATWEINSRWPEYKQRNVAIMPDLYGREYTDNMTIGIQLVRDQHHQLKSAGETTWFISSSLKTMLDELAGVQTDL